MKKDGFILYMSDSIIETDAGNIMKKYTGKAINGCSGSLKEITIPEEVIEIGRDAFRNKRGLKNVKLPNNLVSIGANAFASTGLEHIEIPASVSSMRISPFCYCLHLEEIIVSEKNNFYCSVDGVLYNKNKCVLKEYPSGRKQDKFVIPEGVEIIAEKAFAGSKYLLQVEFPRSMTVISTRAFSCCYSLQEVIIPNWVTRIESRAFAYCSNLKKIVLPKGIYIDRDAFLGSDDVCVIFNKTDDTPKIISFDLQIRQIEKTDEEEPNQIILSKKFCSETFLTSETEHVFSTKCERTAFGKQKIGGNLFFVPKEDLVNIDELGIIKLGTYVNPGDILVCKGTLENSSPESRLLHMIFGESATSYADTSLRVPFNVRGEVTDVKVFYEKDKNGNILHDTIEAVSITILQKFPLSVGDILEDDDGNKGIVTAFDPNLRECEIVANFPLGKKITKQSIAERTVQMRSVGEYALFGQYPIAKRDYYGALSHIVSGIPQKIYFEDITKFANNGLIDVLENIIAFQADQPKNRLLLYDNILTGKPTNVFYLPAFDVNEFFCLLYALCLKPVFRDKEGKELQFSYIEKNSELNKSYGEEIVLEIDKLSDDEIRKMSYGEVTKPETLNMRTHEAEKDGLFCEKIFGPVKDYECQCGRCSGYRYKEKVCEKCGVEVTSSSVRYERFGHIELATPIKHPFLPDSTLFVLPILPPKLRPMAKRSNGSFVTSDLNDLYRRVINLNNRLKRLLELGASDITVENEKRMLQKAIDSLFNNSHLEAPVWEGNGRVLKPILDHLKDSLSKHLECDALDYSAACNTIIDDSLSDEQCGLPFQIALELFKPFLINKLCETGKAKNFKNATRQINAKAIDRKTAHESGIIDLLATIIRDKKILIFSKDTNGKILSLSPILTFNNVLTLNFTQYKTLKLQIGETLKIIFPASDAAQGMLRNRCASLLKTGNIFEREANTDFIKKLAIASTEKSADIVPLLLESIQNHEVCAFDTVVSRYILGKPSKRAMDFYKTPSISEDQSDLEEDKMVYLDIFDEDEDEEEEITDEDDLSDVDFEELFNDDF